MGGQSANLTTTLLILMRGNLEFDDTIKIFLQETDKTNLAPPKRQESKH